MSLFTELKNRSVLQVGIGYLVSSWLVIQVSDILLGTFDAPEWVMRGVVILLAIGFPIALVISWVFDLTPEGIRRTDELSDEERRRSLPGPVANFAIIGILAAAVILFALDKFLWQTDLGTGGGEGELPVVAVLPFANLSGDERADPFTKGIHDDLLTQLSKISSIRTLSRTSVERYKETQLTIPQIADELGASAVVEGGVQRSADRLRINAQLIDADSDAHLWGETFDRNLTATDVFAIQSEISKSIARALSAVLTPSELQALDTVPTENLEAYDLYLQGRSSLESNAVGDLTTAAEQFTGATTLDPRFAGAWAGLCEAQLRLYRLESDVDQFEVAEDACLRALTIDPNWAEVHLALGTLYRYVGRYAEAEDEVEQVLFAMEELYANRSELTDKLRSNAHGEMALILAEQGRLVEAEAELNQAIEIRPEDAAPYQTGFGFYYRYSDREDRLQKVIDMAEKLVETQPDSASAHNQLGTAYHRVRRFDDALNAWQRSIDIEPTRTAYTNIGLVYYYDGKFEQAAEMQRQAAAIAPEDHRVWGRQAESLRFAGDEQGAQTAYETAIPLAKNLLVINELDWRTRALLANYLVHSGDSEAAQIEIDRALADSNGHGDAYFFAALIAVSTGDDDKAVFLLEQSVAKEPSLAIEIANEPDFQHLRGRAEFDAIARSAERQSGPL